MKRSLMYQVNPETAEFKEPPMLSKGSFSFFKIKLKPNSYERSNGFIHPKIALVYFTVFFCRVFLSIETESECSYKE